MTFKRKWRLRLRAIFKLLPFYLGLKTFGAMAQVSGAPVGFQSGLEFQYSRIKGTVEVQCLNQDHIENRKIVCRDTVLTPRSFDYFVGPVLPEADMVLLRSLQEDSDSKGQQATYSGRSGISLGSFNLWRTGFFAKPLLKEGQNSIAYSLWGRGRALSSGVFEVNVSRGEPKSCPNSSIQQIERVDCNSYYSICQQYFEAHNYCL